MDKFYGRFVYFEDTVTYFDKIVMLSHRGGGGGGEANRYIRLYVKSHNPFKISFKLKLRSFISVPSLLEKEINAFDFFGIE